MVYIRTGAETMSEPTAEVSHMLSPYRIVVTHGSHLTRSLKSDQKPVLLNRLLNTILHPISDRHESPSIPSDNFAKI